MIKVENIDVDYKQHGNICMFASYSIIINYYSDKDLNQDNIFSKVIGLFPGFLNQINKVLATTPKEQRKSKRENLISGKYHKHCQANGDIRGFDYITSLHNTNALGTKDYCIVLKNNAIDIKVGFIPLAERLDLRDKLKIVGGLAMILFPENSNLHSIVVGFDFKKDSYFKRDPNYKEIFHDDFLQSNDICEYIWFSDK